MFFPIDIKIAILDPSIIQQKFLCVRFNEPKTILQNNRALSSNFRKPKTLSENAVRLPTHLQTVASVPRFVLNFWIALRKPKSDSETIKFY